MKKPDWLGILAYIGSAVVAVYILWMIWQVIAAVVV